MSELSKQEINKIRQQIMLAEKTDPSSIRGKADVQGHKVTINGKPYFTPSLPEPLDSVENRKRLTDTGQSRFAQEYSKATPRGAAGSIKPPPTNGASSALRGVTSTLRNVAPALNVGMRGLSAINVANPNLTPTQRGHAAISTINPLLGLVTENILQPYHDFMSKATNTEGAVYQGRTPGYNRFGPRKDTPEQTPARLSSEPPQPLQQSSGRPKASGTVITIDGKRYDTGYHAEEIAVLKKKYPGGGNAGQSQSINPNNSSYIPPTRNTKAPVKNPYNIPQSGTQMTIGDFESNIGVKVANRTSDDYKVNPISRMEELSLDSNLDSLEALRQSEARRGIVNQGNDRGMRMRFLNTDNGLERITDEGYKVLMNQKAGSALDDNFLEQYKYNPAGNKDVQKWMGKTKAEINAAYDAMSPEEKKAQGMNMHKAFMVDQDNPASKAKGKATAWQATANSPSKDIQPIKINDSGQVSQQSVYQGFMKRGLSDSDAKIGAAIMMGESGGNPIIDTVQSGLDPDKSNEFSVGLMQINTKAHMDKLTRRGLSVDDLRNPETNLDLAVDVFKEAGGSWSPWGAYTNKSYEQFLN